MSIFPEKKYLNFFILLACCGLFPSRAFSIDYKIFQPLPRLLSHGEVILPIGHEHVLVALDLGPINNADMAVIKINHDGELIKKFGNQGIFRDETSKASRVFGMGVQKNGRIILAGFERKEKNKNLLLLAVTQNGILDTKFGDKGRMVLDLGGNEEAHYLQILSDDSIAVAGFVGRKGNNNFLVAHFTANGLPDTHFSEKGWLEIDHGNDDRFYGLSLQKDKMVAAGVEKKDGRTHCVIASFLRDGQLDAAFGQEGFVVLRKNSDSGKPQDTACSAIVNRDNGFWMTGYIKDEQHTKALVAYLDVFGEYSFTDIGQDYQLQMAHGLVVDGYKVFVAGEGIRKSNRKQETGFFVSQHFIPFLSSGLDLENASVALDPSYQLWFTGHVRGKLIVGKISDPSLQWR